MRAITVAPGTGGSARIEDVPEPALSDGSVLVEAIALGVCGTDREIVSGHYGWAPPNERRLILGHESLGRVIAAPPQSALAPGELVVGIVRRPDPVPCVYCAAGEWDMCRNGRYTERGIKERHGYGAERFRIEPEFAIKIDPALGWHGVLLEPASILAKAWDHAESIGRRATAFSPRTVLITGAGPIGLLAAMIGAERGLAVHVFDRHKGGTKPDLVGKLGATYHNDLDRLQDIEPDIVIECTGAPPLIRELLGRTAPAGIICLAGLSEPGSILDIDMGQLNRTLVLGNDVMFGSVNANRRHYEAAARMLACAGKDWLAGLITRRVPLDRFAEALEARPDDIKVVIDFAPA